MPATLNLFSFLYRVAGQAYAELLEDLAVDFAEHDGRVDLAAVEFRELLEGTAAVVVGDAEHGEGDEDLIGVQAWVVAVEERHLCLLDRGYHLFRDELDAMRDAGEMLGGVQDQGCARSEE